MRVEEDEEEDIEAEEVEKEAEEVEKGNKNEMAPDRLQRRREDPDQETDVTASPIFTPLFLPKNRSDEEHNKSMKKCMEKA